MIRLSLWSEAYFRPAKQNGVTCRNCEGDAFPKRKPLPVGHPRVVVMGGSGPCARHLSLCVNCAVHEATALRLLSDKILSAINNKDIPTLTKGIG
jgi:ribosomal protein S26